MKICVECSNGGHLDEMMSILEAFQGHDVFFFSTQGQSPEILSKMGRVYPIRKGYYIKNRDSRLGRLVMRFETIFREVWCLARMIIPCARILRKEKPQLVVSAGGSAIPVCYLGKLFRTKVIFIESLTRIQDLSMSGKLVYPLADVFLVQWESLARRYPKARFRGRMI